MQDGTIPCSDGAGDVISIGSKVSRFKQGDRVAATFFQTLVSGSLTPFNSGGALGSSGPGMLADYAVLNESGLVSIPEHLSYEQASTLPCAGVTAWNALMGGGRKMQAGDTIVTQGTGGVSMFAAQFGVAVGAKVISTSSSTKKMETLKDTGVHHVVNYDDRPNWGQEVKKLTGGEGADFVIEIGGPDTIQQSLRAVKIDGSVAIIGQRTGQDPNRKSEENMMLTDAFKHICTMRRIMLGSRDHFEDMNRSIAVNSIRPVVDKAIFEFEDSREAFRYLDERRHVGNVVIRNRKS